MIELGLLITAIVLAVILFPIGWIYSLLTARLSIKKLRYYFLTIAISIDQLGCVILGPLLNNIFVIEGGRLYGNEDNTISEILGHNKYTGHNTKLATILAKLLNKIDPDHVEKAAGYK